MQRTLTALLLFLFTLPAWAQMSVPGTFTRVQPRRSTRLYSSLYYTPVITTPQMTFDSALTPPMVASSETMVMSAPSDDESGVASEESGDPSELSERGYSGRIRLRSLRVAPFDFVVAPTDGVHPGESEDSGSLGETAAAIRKGPPPTQRNFTNDDINRMNESSGGNMSLPAAKPQEEHPQPPANVQPQNNQLQEKHSPFVPQLTAEE